MTPVRKFTYTSLLVAVFAVALLVFVNIQEDVTPVNEEIMYVSSPPLVVDRSPAVTIGDTHIVVELATTTPAIRTGLSERSFLAENMGMLFMFKKPDSYRFWMPDMQFPLDMIWIEDAEVKDITHEATNEFDPSKPVFYKPSSPVRYVLEVNAGFARRHNISIGDRVVFSYIDIP